MRPIEIASFSGAATSTDHGPAPQLQWIDVRILVVDDTYQRPLTANSSRRSIRRIAAAFEWRHFAPVVVSPVPGGLYAIIDGQHRCTAAALCGIKTVPCSVVLADRCQQAEAFRAINGDLTRVTPGRLFRARLEAGDPAASHLWALAAKAGVRIVLSNKPGSLLKPNETIAFGLIVKLIGAYGDEVVVGALASILRAAGDGENGLKAVIIRAFAEVLADHKDWLRHAERDAAMAGFDVLSAFERAQVNCKRRPGTTASSLLQADLVDHLGARLAPIGAMSRAAE